MNLNLFKSYEAKLNISSMHDHFTFFLLLQQRVNRTNKANEYDTLPVVY